MRKRKMLIICMAVVMIFTACEPMSTKEEKINGDELAKIEKKSPMEIGRHLMMNLSDNIKVDADITGINELSEYKASSFKCTLHTFDEIKSYKQLSDYFDIEEKDAEVVFPHRLTYMPPICFTNNITLLIIRCIAIKFLPKVPQV